MRIILAVTLVVAALTAPTFAEEEDTDWPAVMELVDVSPEGELMQALDHMQRVAPHHMHYHINRIAKHAVLMQTNKAEAYNTASAEFNASKDAIKAAIRALASDLDKGRTYDKKAMADGQSEGNNAINTAKTNAQAKCQTFKDKACPTRREELEADAAKAEAKKTMQAVGKGKVCSGLQTVTWGDMDVDKVEPKEGDELRNKWNKKREEYEEAETKFNAAEKKRDTAEKKHDAAMTELKEAIDLDAKNVHQTCQNSHTEFNVLKGEIASNVNARKQVFMATLIVTCYVDHLTDNAAAKTCADNKRNEEGTTDEWNITPVNLAACATEEELKSLFGPTNWVPTSSGCKEEWNKPSGQLVFDFAF